MTGWRMGYVCGPAPILQQMLKLHQFGIMSAPTTAQFAGIEAIRTHGCVKGLLLTAWRIARCNPLGRWGYDPVPEKGRWKNPARHLSASALFSTRHEK